MITIKTMFELHTVELKLKIEAAEKELVPIKNLKQDLEKYLIDNKNTSSIKAPIEEVLSGTYGQIIPIRNSFDAYFNIKLRDYNHIHSIYTRKVNTLQALERQKINKVVFNYIIKRFNVLLYKEMVHKAYQFKDLFLGEFFVHISNNKKATINWGVSLQNKAKLLEEGKIPYTKAGEQEAKDRGEEYKGEQWLDYLPEKSLFYQWLRTSATYIRLPNIKNFVFRPYRGINSPVKELALYRNAYTDEELINHFKTKKIC